MAETAKYWQRPHLYKEKKKLKLIYEIKLTRVSANGYQSAHFTPILSDIDVLSRSLASHLDAQGINVHTMKRRTCQVQTT